MPASRTAKKLETFNAPDRKAWREWLSRNYGDSKGIWLVVRKKNFGESGISLEDAVDEAVCFGWIDSRLNVADEQTFRLLFTPRKLGSIWSRTNKERVEKLIRQGLMTAAGLEKVEAAKKDGSWNRLDAVEELRVPKDLGKALAADKTAQRNFELFRDSAKKQILWWIESAKTQETRSKRISKAVTMAAENRKEPSS